MSEHHVGDVDTDELDDVIPEADVIESDFGLTVAFKYGKTSAREARFRSSSGEAISAIHPVDTKGYGRDWIIRSGKRIIAVFHAYEVIGVWATGDADTKTIKD